MPWLFLFKGRLSFCLDEICDLSIRKVSLGALISCPLSVFSCPPTKSGQKKGASPVQKGNACLSSTDGYYPICMCNVTAFDMGQQSDEFRISYPYLYGYLNEYGP